VPKFQSAARGRDYAVGVPAPGEAPLPEARITEIQVPEFATPAPSLATIERLDPIAAARNGGTAPVAPPPLPIPPVTRSIFDPTPTTTAIPTPQIVPSDQRPGQSLSQTAPMTADFVVSQTWDLTPLGLNADIRAILEAESWSIERLAVATEAQLTAYKGIGAKRAQTIIETAKGLIAK